jgi:hypothetical protein
MICDYGSCNNTDINYYYFSISNVRLTHFKQITGYAALCNIHIPHVSCIFDVNLITEEEYVVGIIIES